MKGQTLRERKNNILLRIAKEQRKKVCSILYKVLTPILIVAILAVPMFRFRYVFVRLAQAIWDLLTSLAFYFLYIVQREDLVTVTVTELPEGMDTLLPLNLVEFKAFMTTYFDKLFSKENFIAYLEYLAVKTQRFAEALSYLLIPILCVVLILFLVYNKNEKGIVATAAQENTSLEPLAAEDTKALQFWKANVEGKVFIPAWTFLKNWWGFITTYKRYWIPLFINAAIALNVATIIIEALAYFIYVSMSIDYGNVFVQAAKFAIDVTVPLQILPGIVTFIIGYKILHCWRCARGKDTTDKAVDKVEKYLKKYPGTKFVCGKQRSSKTTLLTFFKRIYERLFRKKAKEKFIEREKQFPFFPWYEYERSISWARAYTGLKKFEDVEIYVARLKRLYKEKNPVRFEAYGRQIKREYKFDWRLLLEYSKKYPMQYENGATVVSLFEALERYGKLFLIYSQNSALDMSNFSIRDDFKFRKGFFPVFDGDMFRSPKESKRYSKFSHIMNYDAFRLGKAFDEKTRFDVAVEYGIGVQNEFAKERKNKETKKGLSNSDVEANQNNDLFELDTKMRAGHIATVDYFDFWVWLWDDQRPGDLGASNKDLTTEIIIKDRTEPKIILPLFAFEELLFRVFSSMRDKVKYALRQRKAKNTLLAHLIDRIYIPFWRFYTRIENRFSIMTLTVKTRDGLDQEIMGESDKLPVPLAVVYNDNFATDNCREFYRMKHRKAKATLEDVETYKTLYPTMEEYRKHRSYRVEDMNYAFGDRFKRSE